MNKLIILLVILLSACATPTLPPEPAAPIAMGMPAGDAVDVMVVDSDESGSTVTFKLTGENYKFVLDGEDNPDLRVPVGSKVVIELTSTDGFHDWTVDEFGATERVQTGGKISVEFVVDKKGSFEYYCSVGSHRLNGMYGKLVVT